MMATLDDVLARADRDLDHSLERLFELLRIPSISTDPAHAPECRRAAQWLVAELASLGFDSGLRDTTRHPMVVAHRAGPDGAPHVLFYGHYDVQPPDPLEKWQTPPFEPVRRTDSDGRERIYARGASDDKGQLMTFVEASRAYVEATGGLPVTVTVLIEGEEECGSPSLGPFLDAHRGELKSDIALVCDTGMVDEATPVITTRLRGLVHEEVIITGPAVDLHSGMYGGPAINPIKVLAGIIADLTDRNGRVTIPGFYDEVRDLSPAIRRQWSDLNFDEEKFLAKVGLRRSVGEEGYSVLEQIWARPTVEINGIIGGYTGVGTKTVIPSQASAKFSFRLVADQNPERIRESFHAFVRERLPAGASVSFGPAVGASPAVHIPESNRFLGAARQALENEWLTAPVLLGSGGSIPIVGNFQKVLGMDSLMIGFALDDDAIHSPNEKYNVESFHKGIRSWIRVLSALANER
jgi:acetylornithine deacetylase/succinyl-diaminopimelate desuccinylase-like protein